MAQPAVAPEAVRALRREIARIEGRLSPDAVMAEQPPLRHPLPASEAQNGGSPAAGASNAQAQGFEAALGGLPREGLVEVTTREARDAGAAAGFSLALAHLFGRRQAGRPRPPLLWIATANTLAELGTPCLAGIEALAGAQDLLLARAPRPADALWIAEEAAAAGGLGPILVEMHGPSAALGLTATRRLHRRAQAAGRALLLLRHAAGSPEPTAAPLRLAVGHAPAQARKILGRPLAGTIGAPAFAVTVTKSRAGRELAFVLDWDADEGRFTERPAPHPGAVAAAPRDRPHPAPAAGAVLAFGSGAAGAARGEPQGEEPPDRLRPRRAG